MTTLTLDTDRLREENAELSAFVAMFATEGWQMLADEIRRKHADTRAKLVLPTGVRDIEEVYAQRERYAVLSWLLDLPEKKADELKLNREQLYELEQREES